MILSSIDIGSNAIRQLIVEVDSFGHFKVLKKHREMIRLGSDVFNYKRIQNITERRLIAAFKRMARLNKKFLVEKSVAFATSAFRDAQNKKPILSAIFRNSGVRIKVISGLKEAGLIRMAVQNTIGLNNDHCLLIDIGGGSVELTHLFNCRIYYSKSFKWGMVRMLTEALKVNVSAQALLKSKLRAADKKLPKAQFNLAIGTGGNMDAIARLKLVLLRKGPNTLVTYDELLKMYKIFEKTPPAQRMQKMELRADRVDVLEPAMFLTLHLMKKYKIKKLKIPGVGLKEGAIMSML
ncbi:MAG: hypothetical protein H7061_14020 [Bdellovibrionaceae bacterium]|nr:hypothetical protein [Bdellovibrio sp.]